jgi:hypothetical protein
MMRRMAIAMSQFPSMRVVPWHVLSVVLVLAAVVLTNFAVRGVRGAVYEATAVVQVQPGADVVSATAQVTSRQSLLAVVRRQGLGGSRSDAELDLAVGALGEAVSVHAPVPEAGGVLRLVLSVQLPDADLSVRVANDLAQQVLDWGQSGALRQGQAELQFFRREELRLWQETSALRGEVQSLAAQSGDAEGYLQTQRQLALLTDQYNHVRERLAQAEVDARLDGSTQKAAFSLLRRATLAEAVPVWQGSLLVGVAGSVLLAFALVFVLNRRSLDLGGYRAEARRGLGLVWRAVDDPARPILGVPRYLVFSAAFVLGMIWVASQFQ